MKSNRYREGVDFFVEMPRCIEGEGPEWDELRRLDGEARSAQIRSLERYVTPELDPAYREAEDRFQELKRKLLSGGEE
jgi:hypothetical protein